MFGSTERTKDPSEEMQGTRRGVEQALSLSRTAVANNAAGHIGTGPGPRARSPRPPQDVTVTAEPVTVCY
jgi:hypothetical protein